MINITIRPETSADYAAIHDIHTRAFDNQIGVATLVALMRSQTRYDADLALVAEIDGRVVGHVIFSPIDVYLNGQVLTIANLSPLGVHPDFQQQGIGGQLVTEGHHILRAKAYDASILLGHSDYYPRFGYRTRAYGASSVTIATQSLPEIVLDSASPVPADVADLMALHHMNEQAINLSLIPENTFVAWLSPNPNVPCAVYRHKGEIVGYTRGSREDVRLFLAKNDEMTQGIAKHLAGDAAEITLPLHPDSSCASAFDAQPTVTAWEAAMLCPLHDDSLMWGYLNAIENGDLVGRVIWSSIFDIA